jgi:predicted N-acyltransferase
LSIGSNHTQSFFAFYSDEKNNEESKLSIKAYFFLLVQCLARKKLFFWTEERRQIKEGFLFFVADIMSGKIDYVNEVSFFLFRSRF